MSFNSEKSRDPFDAVKIKVLTQASSAIISSMCLDVNERKCMTKAPWECDIPKQVPVTNFTYNTVKRRQCKKLRLCALMVTRGNVKLPRGKTRLSTRGSVKL